MKEHLQENLGREPTDVELAKATNMDVLQVRKQIAVGRAARNKLIKVMIYFQIVTSTCIKVTQFTEEAWALIVIIDQINYTGFWCLSSIFVFF